MTNDNPPVPGLGSIKCRPADAQTDLRALKQAISLGKWALEALG